MSEEQDADGRRRGSGGGGDANAWMSTFSDLLLLMLTFFVLLLSMSSMTQSELAAIKKDGVVSESPEAEQMLAKVDVALSPNELAAQVKALAKELDLPMNRRRLERVRQLLQELTSASGLQGPMWVEQTPKGVLVNFDGSILFEEGSARLTERSRTFLRQFAASLRAGSQHVVTEAFVEQGEGVRGWEETWDLALRRADRTVNFLIDEGIRAKRLSIAGYGFEAGKAEMRFLRNAELIRFHLLVGPPGAEAGERSEQAPRQAGGE